MRGDRRFLEFVRNTGFAPSATPPPVQGPGFGNAGSSPSVPHGRPRPQPLPMGVGGGTFTDQQMLDQLLNSTFQNFDEPNEMNQQFLVARDPEIARQVALNKPLAAPITFRPNAGASSPSRSHGDPEAVWQGKVAQWKRINADRQAQGLAPVNLDGSEYPADRWARLDPVAQASIYRDLQNSTPAREEFRDLPEWAKVASDVARDNPVTNYVIEPTVKILGIPEEKYRMETMDAAYYMATHNGEIPNDWSDPGTFIAHWLMSGDPMPVQLRAFPPPGTDISNVDWLRMTPDQQEQAYRTAAAESNNPLSKLQIITYVADHPELRPIVQKVYEDAEANGQDGTRALDAWFADQQGLLTSMFSSVIFDPLNLAAGTGLVGRALSTAAKTMEAEKGVTTGSRIVRTGGRILEAPDAVVNKPLETGAAITRGVAETVGGLPGVRTLRDLLTQPGAQQKAVDAMATVENTVERGAEIATRAADDVRANRQADDIAKRRRGEANAPQFTPERTLTPEEVAAEREIQQRATERQAGNRPKPAAQSRVVSPQDQPPTGAAGQASDVFDGAIGVNDPLPPAVQSAWDANADIIGDPTGGRAIREIPVEQVPADARLVATQHELYPETVQRYVADPSWRQSDELPIAIYDGSEYFIVGGHHRVAAARESGFDTIPMRVINATPVTVADDAAGITPEIVSRAVADNFPSNLPSAEPVAQARFSITPDAQKQRAIDTIARDYPEAWDAIAPQLDEWATTEYEPAINKLRTASIDSSDIPGAAPLPDNYATRKAAMDAGGRADREIVFYEGTNKAMAAALEGDYYGRLRFLAYANGVPLDKVAWRIDPRLERAIADRGLEKMGYRADETFKHQTREALVTAYIHADEADAPYILEALEDAHVVRAKTGATEAARLENLRYQIITDARRRAQLTPEEMDQLLRDAGLEPKPVQVAQEDLAVLPDETTPAPNGQVPSGGSLASQMTAQLKQLPEEVRAAAVKQVADWARVNMADFAVKTPRERVLTELEYAAEVRRAALKNGVDIAPPPMDYNVDDTIDNMLRAIVLEPDESITAPLRKELYDAEVLRKEIDPPWEGVTNPDVYVAEKVAFDTYQKTQDLHRALHGPPHEALRRNGRYESTGKWEVYKNPDGKGYLVIDPDGHADGLPIPNKRDAVKQAKAKATAPEAEAARRTFAFETEYRNRLNEEIAAVERDIAQTDADADAVLADLDRVLRGEPPTPKEVAPPRIPTVEDQAKAKAAFEETAARPMRPLSLADYSGDQLVADALASGGIDKETAETLSRMVTLADGRQLSVMDVVLEKMVAHDDLITAHRAAASDIADAIRTAKRAASADIITADAITMPKLNKALRANRYYLNLVREAYLVSPARVISATSLDGIGNAWFQLIGGRGGAVTHTLNPLGWVGFAKHTMSGAAIRHPLFEIAEKTGMKVDPSIINVVTRDLLDPGVETTWSDFLSKRVFFGKAGLGTVGDKASSIIAPKWGKALRHGLDQNARASAAWDVAMKELPDARNDLLLHIRQTQGDAAANALVDKLSRSGAFSPDDVLKYTNDKSLSRFWRERLTEIEKKQVAEVNRIHFDFKITKADEALRNVALFHFWQSRAMVYYAKTVLSNPYLLALHVKAWNAAEKEAERQDAGNPFNLFLKYMGGNGGLYGYIDPISWVVPYIMYRDASVEYNGESGFDKYTRKTGIFWNPVISAAVTALGQSDRFPALIPTTSLQTLVRSVIDWDRNHGDVLGKGPGMTGDPITYFQNRVMDVINNGLHRAFPELVGDVPMPDLKNGQTRQVTAIIIEQAEKDFGVPYDQMTPEQRNEVLAAVNSLSTTPNARAEEALATWSNGRIIQSGANMVIPGRTTVRSEAYDERRKLINEAFDTPANQRTPEQQNALAQNELANAGSPESATLAVDRRNLGDMGTEYQQALYDGWNTIVYGDASEILPWSEETIGGKVYTGQQILDMTPDERRALADLWVLDNKGTDELQSYRDQRKAAIAESPELTSYDGYKKSAQDFSDPNGMFPDGIRGFRQWAAKADPNYARAEAEQRQKLMENGYGNPLVADQLEKRLDEWAMGSEAFNAFRGVKDRLNDPDPTTINDPTALPPTIPTGDSSGGSGKSSGAAKKDEMPTWQVDLAIEYDDYGKVIADFEQQNGPLSNFQSPLGQKFVAQWFKENGLDPSGDLKAYLKWKAEQDAAGEDSSLSAYFRVKNTEYDQRQEGRDAKRKELVSSS